MSTQEDETRLIELIDEACDLAHRIPLPSGAERPLRRYGAEERRKALKYAAALNRKPKITQGEK